MLIHKKTRTNQSFLFAHTVTKMIYLIFFIILSFFYKKWRILNIFFSVFCKKINFFVFQYFLLFFSGCCCFRKKAKKSNSQKTIRFSTFSVLHLLFWCFLYSILSFGIDIFWFFDPLYLLFFTLFFDLKKNFSVDLATSKVQKKI